MNLTESKKNPTSFEQDDDLYTKFEGVVDKAKRLYESEFFVNFPQETRDAIESIYRDLFELSTESFGKPE